VRYGAKVSEAARIQGARFRDVLALVNSMKGAHVSEEYFRIYSDATGAVYGLKNAKTLKAREKYYQKIQALVDGAAAKTA
jgi:hypothetical protein